MPALGEVKVNNPLLQRATKRLVADGRTASQLASFLDCDGSTFEIFIVKNTEQDTAGKVRELGRSQPSPLTDVDFDVDTGKTKEYGRAARMDWKTKSNIQPGLDIQAILMSAPYEELQLQQELDFVTVAQATANMGGTQAAAAVWTAAATDIRGQLIDAKYAFKKQARGKAPDSLLIPPGAWSSIQKNTDFIERYKYAQGAVMTEHGLEMEYLEGLKLFVPGRVYNSAAPGATVATDYVWPYDSTSVAVVFRNTTVNAKESMGWIRTVRNTAYGPGGELADTFWDAREKTFYYDYRSDWAYYVQVPEYALGITGIHA